MRDAADAQVAESDSLRQAHQQWQTLTQSAGRIIDRRTGQDVTPEPDENGRYAVIDKDGQQIGSFDDQGAAELAWDQETDRTGKIIDMQTKTDVTPRQEAKLNDAQLQAALRLAHGLGATKVAVENDLQVDADLVAKYIERINTLDIPAFNIVNLRGRGRHTPTKTVPITRREVTIETVRKQVEVERPGPRRPSKWVFVNHPTDDPEPAYIRSTRDLARVRPRAFALPTEVFAHRLARKQLMRRAYQEEIEGEPTVKKQYEWQEVEEPKVREWTENVEVAEEQQAQLLELIVDVSGSMGGCNINLAIALAIVVMSAHLDDDSRYLYRQFALDVGKLTDAKSSSERRALCAKLFHQDNDLGGGTDINRAIAVAAADVRERARAGQATEVLLITDAGDDYVTTDSVSEIIRDDVVLHAVVVGGASWRAQATTNYELCGTPDGQVWGATERVIDQVPADAVNSWW